VALEDMQVCFIPKVEVMSFFDKKISFQWMSWNHLWRPQRCWWAHGQYGSKNSEAAISKPYSTSKILSEKIQMAP
jgi:hypothetical protein